MRIGAIVYATEQGLGRLGRDFYANGLVTDVAMFRHGSYPNHPEWYPPGTLTLVGRPFDGPVVDAWLRPLDWVLFFETPWDWAFPDYCRRRGKKTALVPMYEWTPTNLDRLHKFDRIIPPSLLDQEYFPSSTFVPVPVRTDKWSQRTRALRFLHNGGHLGYRGHKGTLELLQAIRYLTTPLTLTVRVQTAAIPEFDNLLQSTLGRDRRYSEAWAHPGGGMVRFERGDVPYESLWDGHDVLVQPEKFNGLSLPLQEARATGMVVMTTDRFPANSWLPPGPLLPVASTHKARVGGRYNEFEESVVDPRAIAAKMDEWYGRDVTEYSLSGREWAEANSWAALLPRWREAFT